MPGRFLLTGFGVVIRDAIDKISGKAVNLACGEFDDSLWVLDITA